MLRKFARKYSLYNSRVTVPPLELRDCIILSALKIWRILWLMCGRLSKVVACVPRSNRILSEVKTEFHLSINVIIIVVSFKILDLSQSLCFNNCETPCTCNTATMLKSSSRLAEGRQCLCEILHPWENLNLVHLSRTKRTQKLATKQPKQCMTGRLCAGSR